MELFLPTTNPWLLTLGVVFLILSIAILNINQCQRDAVLERLHFHRGRTSSASTPPRSISPGEKGASYAGDNKKTTPTPVVTPDYVNTFPPSRRAALAELAKDTVSSGAESSTEALRRDQLPTTRSYDLENATPKYTPTGFSTAEIKSLGDFPAYDILSGVPLPEPYKGFNPARALPRPYRPFRWAYHQTMCKCIPNEIKQQS